MGVKLADIESLFESFDAEADPLLDDQAADPTDEASAAIAMGLAIRLTTFVLGSQMRRSECEQVAASLVTELNTLRRSIATRSPGPS
jgi:hypothetical protein